MWEDCCSDDDVDDDVSDGLENSTFRCVIWRREYNFRDGVLCAVTWTTSWDDKDDDADAENVVSWWREYTGSTGGGGVVLAIVEVVVGVEGVLRSALAFFNGDTGADFPLLSDTFLLAAVIISDGCQSVISWMDVKLWKY